MPISCQYFTSSHTCKIVASLSKTTGEVDIHTCLACQSSSQPMQINTVTAGLSIGLLALNKKPNDHLLKYVVPELFIGPGTELKKLVSWFIWLRDVKDCTNCYNREQQMNQWGPEECRKNITTIVEWLRESAAKQNIPFSETLVRIIINKAIRNSEKHSESLR